jgi:hypothetical protein
MDSGAKPTLYFRAIVRFSRLLASLMGLKKAVLRWFAAAPTWILAVAKIIQNTSP